MLRMRDLLKVVQPDLVTPEGTLVFPGVSLTEPPGINWPTPLSWKPHRIGKLRRRGAIL